MVVEGQDDDELGKKGKTTVEAYLDKHRHYIAAQTLDAQDIMLHEGAHVLFSFGIANIFNEPLAMHVESDISQVMGVQDEHGSSYGPHNRLFHGILRASGLSFGQVAGMAAGDDPEANFQQFRGAVNQGAGWDVADIAQDRYHSHILGMLNNRATITTHEQAGIVMRAATLVEQELAPRLPPPDLQIVA
jgi:hypothetical protein